MNTVNQTMADDIIKHIESFYEKYNKEIGSDDMTQVFEKYRLYCGRMVSGSKITPKGQFCVWNANVLSPTKGKIWFGDLNITQDGDRLKEVAKELGETLYVLREHDCRFGTEDEPLTEQLKKSVWDTELGVDMHR
jgi:hypothetical protein